MNLSREVEARPASVPPGNRQNLEVEAGPASPLTIIGDNENLPGGLARGSEVSKPTTCRQEIGGTKPANTRVS